METLSVIEQIDAVLQKAVEEVRVIIKEAVEQVPSELQGSLHLDFHRLGVVTGVATCTIPNWGLLEERYVIVEIRTGKAKELQEAFKK